ncbi:MAG: recombinase [Clostridia bacterium]|nr:recombinase [Clostridia bacterium]
MKNPNGYGTVVKLSGNRRNPYAVRKTIGWNKKGHPVYQAIGYASTREEGLMMLAEYNRNPYDVDMHKITVEEVYQKWSDRDFTKMSKSLTGSMKSAWKHCSRVYGIKYRELKAYQMQDCIDKCGCGYATQGAIKNLFGHLDDFAMELDIIVKRCSDLTSAPPIPDTKKIPFTDDEVTAVWQLQGQDWVDSILVFLYMGWRISELLGIKTANVDLVEQTITAGTKTRNGKNRIVPIHPRILPFIQARMAEGNEYLFSYNGKHCSSSQYYIFWNVIMEQLHMQHTPHECRHTFRSRLDSAGANKVCIDLLMGHKSKEVGERVYTHKTIQELKDTINLLL